MDRNTSARSKPSGPLEMSKDIEALCNILNSYKASRPSSEWESIDQSIRVLRSPCFSCVSNVFELMMNALGDSDVSYDVRLKAASQGTVAAFMASMGGQAHPRLVEIEKSETQGLGFNVMGGAEQKCPLFVARVIPNGPADRRKRSVLKGDQIICVNGVNVENANHETCVELLKQAKGIVSLVVKYTPDLLRQFENKLATKRLSNSGGNARIGR